MTLTNRALVLGITLWAGTALADYDRHLQKIGTDYRGWAADVPALNSTWLAPTAEWDAQLPAARPVDVDFPGLGDWYVEPSHPDDGEYHCMAIGCQDGAHRNDAIIRIGDCSKGPC